MLPTGSLPRNVSYTGVEGCLNSGHETLTGGFIVVWNLVVYCLDCCKSVSVRDGDRGSMWVSADGARRHQDPSADSPSLGGEPRGARVVFTNTLQKNGTRWALRYCAGWNPWLGSLRSSLLPPAPSKTGWENPTSSRY